METTRKLALAAIALTILASLLVFNDMPQMMASHWDAQGIANGYMDRIVALFMLPLLSGGIYALLILLPYIDPLGKNIRDFHPTYERLALALVLFFSYMHALLIMYNLGIAFDFVVALVPAFAGLFFVTGSALAVAKPNWTIGIRTPWTMSNTEVWDRTHALGAKMFKAGAVLSLGGILVPSLAIFFILVPALASGAFLVIYSYMEYNKVTRRER